MRIKNRLKKEYRKNKALLWVHSKHKQLNTEFLSKGMSMNGKEKEIPEIQEALNGNQVTIHLIRRVSF